MGTKIAIEIETEYAKYPVVIATYDGTTTARFWRDPYLRKSVVDAVALASEDKDIFDFCNFVFAQVNNATRRRYHGQELQLESIEAIGNSNTSIISCR